MKNIQHNILIILLKITITTAFPFPISSHFSNLMKEAVFPVESLVPALKVRGVTSKTTEILTFLTVRILNIKYKVVQI